jgi:drug/metabolite transporter (DMT)-like permease
MKTGQPSRGLVIAAFIAIYFVWGTTYLANLFALQGLPPFIISCFRYVVAGLFLLAWAKGKRAPMPGRASVRVLCISGILMLIGGSGLIVYAEQYVNSGYAAVLVATEPLWFVLLDRKRWKQYFSNRMVLGGLVLGFIGIVLFACFAPPGKGPAADTTFVVGATIIVLISAVLWVSGTLYSSKRTAPGSSNVMNASIQLLAAGVFSGVVALVKGEWNGFSFAAVSLNGWGGLFYLIIMGSVVAYLAFTWLVTVQPPAIVSTHTFVNPLVAILTGWLIAGEQVTGKQAMGLALALAGVVLTQVGKNKFAAEE